MYCEDYKQLSLIAEDDVAGDYCDWSIDTNPSPELARSIERVLDYFHGGQPQTRILSMEGNGGQPPLDSALHDGGQIKNSIFHKDRGDDGTWIEKQNRKTGTFEYLRWRDLDGTKRAKYLGKVA
jgi:hypothetical protein